MSTGPGNKRRAPQFSEVPRTAIGVGTFSIAWEARGSPICFSTAGEVSFSTYGSELELGGFGWYEPRGTKFIC